MVFISPRRHFFPHVKQSHYPEVKNYLAVPREKKVLFMLSI